MSGPRTATKTEWKAAATEAWIIKPGTSTSRATQRITFLDDGKFALSGPLGTSGSGSWQLSADRSRLPLISSGGSSASFSFAALTSSTLQLSKSLENVYVTKHDPATNV